MLHRSGCDPDFSATKRFQIDVQPLIDTLIEKSRAEEERRLVEVTQKLEEAIASRQEAEAKLQHAENKIKELEQGTGKPGGTVSIHIIYMHRLNLSLKMYMHSHKLNNPNNIILLYMNI